MTKRARRRRHFLPALALGLVACGGVTYTTSANDGGSDASNSEDASVGVADAAVDRYAPNEASDAHDAADASAPTCVMLPDASAYDGSAFSCATGSFLFCEDFDESATVAQGWDMGPLQVPDGGTVGVDTTVFETSPRSAIFRYVGPMSPDQLLLEKDQIPLPDAGTFDIAFDWYVASPDAGANAEILRATAAGTPYGEVDLFLDGTSAHFEVYQGPLGGLVHTVGESICVPAGAWIRVSVHFANQQVTLALDGFDAGSLAFPYGDPTYMQMNLQVGLGGGAGDVRIDDVRVVNP